MTRLIISQPIVYSIYIHMNICIILLLFDKWSTFKGSLCMKVDFTRRTFNLIYFKTFTWTFDVGDFHFYKSNALTCLLELFKITIRLGWYWAVKMLLNIFRPSRQSANIMTGSHEYNAHFNKPCTHDAWCALDCYLGCRLGSLLLRCQW